MLLAGAVALVATTPGDDAKAAEPFAASKRCSRGYVHASIAGRHRCLRVGQRCKRTWDRAYHRNGFHCHTGRLIRKHRPAPPPPPPPARDLGPPGAPGCQPPSPAQAWGNGLVEAKGTAAAGEMWVLLFQGVWARGGNATFTDAVGRPFKIVWRDDGRAALSVSSQRLRAARRRARRVDLMNRDRIGTAPATSGARASCSASRAAGKSGPVAIPAWPISGSS